MDEGTVRTWRDDSPDCISNKWEDCAHLLGAECACLSFREGGTANCIIFNANFIPSKKSLFFQHLFPFSPSPSFFPGHRILPRNQEEHHPTVLPGLPGLATSYSLPSPLLPLGSDCQKTTAPSGQACDFLVFQDYSKAWHEESSASAASTKQKDLTAGYSFMPWREFPCSEIQPLKIQGADRLEGYNSELGIIFPVHFSGKSYQHIII